jgi:hypothetical protein
MLYRIAISMKRCVMRPITVSVMKQTTNIKSSRPDSCQRSWRLFSITTAYFSCSEVLKPYLFKYLETAAYDKRRAYHGINLINLVDEKVLILACSHCYDLSAEFA